MTPQRSIDRRGVFFMALQYKNQSKLEALSRKTGLANYRMSDQADVVYGGRGTEYDELVYLNGQNSDAATVNRKRSDAWLKFSQANGVAGSNRADQQEREFGIEGTYP